MQGVTKHTKNDAVQGVLRDHVPCLYPAAGDQSAGGGLDYESTRRWTSKLRYIYRTTAFEQSATMHACMSIHIGTYMVLLTCDAQNQHPYEMGLPQHRTCTCGSRSSTARCISTRVYLRTRGASQMISPTTSTLFVSQDMPRGISSQDRSISNVGALGACTSSRLLETFWPVANEGERPIAARKMKPKRMVSMTIIIIVFFIRNAQAVRVDPCRVSPVSSREDDFPDEAVATTTMTSGWTGGGARRSQTDTYEFDHARCHPPSISCGSYDDKT